MSVTNDEMSKWDHDKIQAEISKLMGETAKLNAKTAKISRERWWYALVPVSAAMGAGAALLGAGLALSKFLTP